MKKYYFHYVHTSHIANDVRLSYYRDKSKNSLDKDALCAVDALKILDMYKIPYTLDSYTTTSGMAIFIWLKENDLKKISKLLLSREWDSTI